MTDATDVFDFPCRFPIKAIGSESPDFEQHVVEIVTAHVGEVRSEDVVARPSAHGNYLAVTVTFTATSREQLDRLYLELTASKKIKVVF